MEIELEHKEWELLNRVACELQAVPDYTAARRKFLQSLCGLIPFALGDFCLTVRDGAAVTLVEPVVASRFSREFEAEFTQKYEQYYGELDYTRWFFSNAESVVYRESDIINNEVRVKTPYYRDYLQPMNLVHVAGVSLAAEGASLGVLALYRTAQEQDFSVRDLYVLNQLLPHLQSRMLAEYKKHPPAAAAPEENQAGVLALRYALTERETQVLGCVLQGKTNAQIAQQLFIAPNTVKKHVGNILSKTQARSRMELLRLPVRENQV